MSKTMILAAGLSLIALALSYLGALGVRHWSPRLGLADIPNERSSHAQPTPRGGGLSFVIVARIIGDIMLNTGAY